MSSCTSCGHQLGVGRFCTNCGAPVDSSTPDGTPVSTPVTPPVTPAPAQDDWRTDTAERRPPRPADPRTPPAAVAPPPPPRYPLFADEVEGTRRTARSPRRPRSRPRSRWPLPWTCRPRWPIRMSRSTSRTTTTTTYDDERRSPVLWILAAALVLVLVTAGWWFLVRDDGSDPTADDGASGQSSQEPGTSTEEGVEVAGRASAKAPKTATPNEDVNGDQVSYDASNMLDGVPDTAWRAPGDGTGMKLTFTLREPTELHQVGLINGYAKTSTDSKGRTFDWYLGNRRIQAVVWVFDDGTKVRQQLAETRELQMVDVPDVVTSEGGAQARGGLCPGRGQRRPQLHRDQRGVVRGDP